MADRIRIFSDGLNEQIGGFLDNFIRTRPRTRLVVLAGLRAGLRARLERGVAEISVEGCVRDAMNTASEHLDSLPDQKAVESDCRDLFKNLALAVRGQGAQFTLGRKGHPSRLSIAQKLSRALVVVLDESRFALPEEAASAPRRRASALAEQKILTVEKVSEALGRHEAELGRFHVKDLRLVGSVARGEARSDSDVDFLVTFDRPTNMDDFFGLKFFLEDLLAHDVDLITRNSVAPRWLERLDREAIHVA